MSGCPPTYSFPFLTCWKDRLFINIAPNDHGYFYFPAQRWRKWKLLPWHALWITGLNTLQRQIPLWTKCSPSSLTAFLYSACLWLSSHLRGCETHKCGEAPYLIYFTDKSDWIRFGITQVKVIQILSFQSHLFSYHSFFSENNSSFPRSCCRCGVRKLPRRAAINSILMFCCGVTSVSSTSCFWDSHIASVTRGFSGLPFHLFPENGTLSSKPNGKY